MVNTFTNLIKMAANSQKNKTICSPTNLLYNYDNTCKKYI